MNKSVFNRSSFLLFAFFVLSNSAVWAQTMPKWVRDIVLNDYAVNTSSSEYHDSYVGFGFSGKNQEEADQKALTNFARNVETQVKQLIQKSITENNLKFTENYQNNVELRTEMSLRGISVSKRYYDAQDNVYYALVVYGKSDYDALFKDELNRKLIRDLENMKADNQRLEAKLEQTKRRAALEDELEKQMTILAQKKTDRFSHVLQQIQTDKWGLALPKYFYNGAYSTSFIHGSINPFTFEPGTVSGAMAYSIISLHTNINYASDATMTSADLGLGVFVLNHTVNGVNIQAGFGVNGYVFLPDSVQSQLFENGSYDYSPVMTLKFNFETFGFSQLSAAVDNRWFYLSYTTMPFLRNPIFGESVSFSAETIFRIHSEIYSENNQAFLTNFSLNLLFSPRMTSHISIRNFNAIMIGVSIR